MNNVYITKVVKVGNSLATVIPKELLQAYDFKRGDLVVFVLATDKLLGVRKVTQKELDLLKQNGEEIIM